MTAPMDPVGACEATPERTRNGEVSSRTEPGPPFRSRSYQSWDGADLGALIRPMLETLAKIADMESTYLTLFDWERREQEVRFVFAPGQTGIQEGHRISLAGDVSEESFPGVTRSPVTRGHPQPDSLVARRLGLKTFVSVPVIAARHRLFGMLCGASRDARELSESDVDLFESFAAVVAERLDRVQMADTEARAAAAEAHLIDRARFLAEAEHRIKTPLAVLQGMALTLRDRRQQLSEPARIELERALVRNVRRLSREIEGLLAEAGADVGSRALSPVDFDLGALVGEIARAFDGLDAIHDVVADAPEELRAFADPTAVYQILGHLIDNAIKYSPDGGLIAVRAAGTASSISLEVIDQGVGLPPDVDLFEAFRRGAQEDRRTPGIGLGLHIVRTLVEAMSGTVTARSDPGAGSTFTVTIPTGART